MPALARLTVSVKNRGNLRQIAADAQGSSSRERFQSLFLSSMGQSSYIPAVRGSRLGTGILVLGGLLAAAYLLGAILGGFLIDWEDDGGDNDRWFWILFLLAGALLLVAGLYLANRSRSLAAGLVSLGALLGAVATFWTIVVPLAAAVLIVLSVLWARQPTATGY